jgi:hypothetical protein
MKPSKTQLLLIIILLALALFPFGWLATFSPLAALFNATFFPHEFARNLGHALLFASLGSILLLSFPALLQRPRRYFALILVIAIGQESFQLLYKQRSVAWNDLSDILIDLTAAGLVFALWYSRANRRAEPRLQHAQASKPHDPAVGR